MPRARSPTRQRARSRTPRAPSGTCWGCAAGSSTRTTTWPSWTRGTPTPELVGLLAKPSAPAGTTTQYANINYVLLGEIIEEVTGRSLAQTVHTGVFDDPPLNRLEYRIKDARAADGWGMKADAATLAHWGYQLYGRSVVSDASLRAMTDFDGESYGLGTVDLSAWDEYGAPGAVGHGGVETSNVVRLVVFPDTGVVIAVQANAGRLEQILPMVQELRGTAHCWQP